MDNSALINEFLIESFENLNSINKDLTLIEKEPTNKELLNSIYRTVHTMKGSASFLGFKKLMEITHTAENLLDEIREDKFHINSNIVDALLQTFDICNVLLAEIESDGAEGELDIEKNKHLLEQLLQLKGEVFEKEENASDEKSSSSNLEDIQNTEEVKQDHENDEELGALISEHRSLSKNDSPSNQKEEQAPSEEFSKAALESMQELVDEGKIDGKLIDEFKASGGAESQGADTKEEGLSQAALESMQELIDEGKIDSSALSQIDERASEDESEDKIQEDVSAAALDSIKELVESGQVSASVLEDLDTTNISSKESEVSPTKEDHIETSSSHEKINVEVASNVDESKKSIADSFVRVNVKVLDKIMNIVGELVLNRNQIVQYSNYKSEHEFTKLSQQLNIITSELQSEVMSTRMQPVGSVLNKFERLVRDFSRQNGKNISLQLFGQETELDKTLIEAIKDPLVHIIRNACDHGLETVEERKKLGKSPEGIITIKSYNESGQVTIEVSDNGRGLNRDKIGDKAIEKGVINPEQLEKMNDTQVFSLIFAPGFSTAEKITNIFGRGVGMDVVKTNIEKIGGSVSVNSELGVGTTFKLRIPLTLAIVPALIVKSKNESFAIPQLNLEELVRLETKEEKRSLEYIQGSEFLKLRGKLTPVFRLSDQLNLNEVHEKNSQLRKVIDKTLMSDSNVSLIQNQVEDLEEALNIVILSAENQSFGIVVDEILDTEEIVVKPLHKCLKHIPMFGGATLMGDGLVALIIDAVGFLNTVCKDRSAIQEQTTEQLKLAEDVHNYQDQHECMLFKLLDEREYAIPLSLVARLEEFDVKDVEKTGNRPILRYLDAPMPLIDLEKCLNLEVGSYLEKSLHEGKGALPCIVVNLRGKNYGLIVSEVLDISLSSSDIDDSAVDREGIFGTVFINNKTISLIDVYQIINQLGFRGTDKDEEDYTKIKMSGDLLVVDDSPMYRKMIHDLVKSLGFQVEVATNGQQALEMAAEKQYDLIITDIEMPVMNGYEFAEKVRNDLENTEQKILALSTRYSEEDQAKGKAAGFNYHMEKFKKDEIIKKIQEIFEGK